MMLGLDEESVPDEESTTDDTKRYPKSVIKISREVGLHPTQKPVALFEWLIKTYSNKGEIVMDNCMGSATTAIAALNTGRFFVGFEKDPIFFERGTKRVAERIREIEGVIRM